MSFGSSSWRHFDSTTDPLMKGLSPELMDLLDDGRERSGVPFYLTSGRRSIEENMNAGGIRDSAHVLGLAADLRVDTPTDLWKMVKGLQDSGAKRLVIGVRIYPDGTVEYFNLHVDIDYTRPTPVLSVKRYPFGLVA